MRTTLDIDEKLLNDIQEITGERNKSKAVTIVIMDYLRSARTKHLLSLKGNLDLDLDDWYEFRHMEK